MKTSTNKDLSKSIFKNLNISTKFGTTFTDTLQTQLSNTYNTYNNTSNDEYLLVKCSEFKNEKDFKKHFNTKSKDKTINSIMSHIVNINK